MPSGGSQVFTYNYGDGSLPKSSPVHSYSLTGAYTITVTAVGNAICPSKSFSSFVLVNDKCETPVCVNDVAICHAPTACINKEWSIANNTIVPSGGSQVFTYNYGDGSLPKSSPVHSYSLTGAYTITVTAVGNAICPSKSFSSFVLVNDKCETPVCVNDIAICHTPTACINKEWSIANNTIVPSGGSQVFTYNYGDGSLPKSSPVHSYSLTGAYTITVTAVGNAICPSKSFSSFVLVNDKCETPVCVNDIAICHSQTACINKEWSITNNTIVPSGGRSGIYLQLRRWQFAEKFSGT